MPWWVIPAVVIIAFLIPLSGYILARWGLEKEERHG